uniref:YfiR family protein n=1 Tax=Thaumasiovibrio occultus TaxID=1891184 RepID=UPI000B34B5BC|nr:YfiR family protein [Thaumasiovibrio occultus]
MKVSQFWHRAFAMLSCAMLAMWPQTVLSGNVEDAEMKAVYLYRFAMFADWSELGVISDTITYCADSGSAVALNLKTIVESRPDTSSFVALWEGQVPEQCHVVYLEQSTLDQIAQLKSRFPHALFIGNGENFISDGGMIAFVKANNRIRPLISRNNVSESGVALRSQLLDIAILVDER